MTNSYNVHIYREMRLTYRGIEADSHDAAASIARDKPTDEADSIDDCEGETLSALVDVQGDEDYEQSRFIDFEEERLRKAAPNLLSALRRLLDDLADAEEDRNPMTGEEYDSVAFARAAIAEATASCPPSAAPRLLSIIDIVPRLYAIRDDLFWQEDTCGIDITAKAELDALIKDLTQSTSKQERNPL